MIVRNTPNKNFTVLRNDTLTHPDLSLKAKGLWAFLMSKPDGWRTTVAGLQSQLKEGERSIRAALTELEKVGLYRKVRVIKKGEKGVIWQDYIYDSPQPAEQKELHSAQLQNAVMQSAGLQNAGQVNTDIAKTEKVSTEKNSTGVELANAGIPVYGKPEINHLFGYWEQKTGYPITSRKQQNRNAANNLLKRHGIEGVRKLIDGAAAAQTTAYAPRISDFEKLQSRLADLLAWGRSKLQEQSETQANQTWKPKGKR